MEIAHSLSGESCKRCVENFVNRRGTPRVMRSDNGTNLVWTALNYKDKYGNPLNWKFIPPAAPAQGGAWERLVRSVKRALSQMEIPQELSDEQLQNFLIKAEALVNSRPLTEIPTHPSEPALTPNHFLFGRSGTELDDGDPETTEDVYDQLLQEREEQREILKRFWERWSKEYLPLIAARTKWKRTTEPLTKDDLVFICEPDGWIRGAIDETFIDPETNQVREVIVRTANRRYRRPATKVAKIHVTPQRPAQEDDTEKQHQCLDGDKHGPVTRARARAQQQMLGN